MKNMIYIRSEAEFSRASAKAFWETKLSLVTGRPSHLLPLDEVINAFQAEQATYLGLQDISLKNIIGSVGRHRDFTPHLLPCARDESNKERWRLTYTRAVSGTGFPPIHVYQFEGHYFIQNGHERASVAAYLGWPTIQAYVTLLPGPQPGLQILPPNPINQLRQG
jgi:hypothetical protein